MCRVKLVLNDSISIRSEPLRLPLREPDGLSTVSTYAAALIHPRFVSKRNDVFTHSEDIQEREHLLGQRYRLIALSATLFNFLFQFRDLLF
jgi:hypothetical protein